MWSSRAASRREIAACRLPTLLLSAAVLLLCTACRAPILSVDDAVIMGDRKSRLAAFVEREAGGLIRKDVEGATVRFYVGEDEIGREKTDEDGRARIDRRLPPNTRQYDARSVVAGAELQSAGRVFEWDERRVVIAVDIDHTIERTEYKELLSDEEDGSDPVKRSVETLNNLARDFHIVYLTGRPRFLLEKTRAWLREREFPEGPIVTAKGLGDALRPGEFKRKQLEDMRDHWPTLLIGIGDKATDADAYGANKMLALAVPPKKSREAFGPHTIVLRDWKALAQFFDANRAALTDPKALKDALDGKLVLKRPVERYKKP
jgi:hypothetical protein